MKQVKLFIYNYGVSPVADFKNNYHDAVQCMKALNDSLIKTHGKLPDSIFYFISYKIKKSSKTLYWVDSSEYVNEVVLNAPVGTKLPEFFYPKQMKILLDWPIMA